LVATQKCVAGFSLICSRFSRRTLSYDDLPSRSTGKLSTCCRSGVFDSNHAMKSLVLRWRLIPLLDLIEVKYLEAWLGDRTSQSVFRNVQTTEFIPWGGLSMFQKRSNHGIYSLGRTEYVSETLKPRNLLLGEGLVCLCGESP